MSKETEDDLIKPEVLKPEKPNTAIVQIHAQMATAFFTEENKMRWAPSGVEQRNFSVQLEEKDKEKAFAELQEKIQQTIDSWNVIKRFPSGVPIPDDEPEIEAYNINKQKSDKE